MQIFDSSGRKMSMLRIGHVHNVQLGRKCGDG
jgi:hypothetical protein